jgi:outer membrane receptor protein involved in Fe transport
MAAFSPAYGSQVYLLPIQNVGNPDLQEETLDAFEVGYTGVLKNHAVLTAAVYFNRLQNQILFTQIGAYSNPFAPPPGFPDIPGLPGSSALVWGGAVQKGVALPSTFSYENFGREKDKGIELGVDTPVSKSVSVFANYAFQADPVVNFDPSEINQPAKNHFNAGLSCDTPRGFGSISVSYVDHAYWQDVLDAPYHGTTPSYAMVNASAGYRMAGGKYTAVLKVTNLGNKQIQQHIFGDVMRRAVVGELRIKLPK